MVDVKAERKKLGLTQKQVSELSGITRAMVGHIETGTANISVKIAKRYEKIFGIPWYNFFEN